MSKILGLDLGTNSIGWAVIDEHENKILNTGVRIFQEGVNRDTGGSEISKNATRSEARQKRKQFFRRKIRRRLLLKKLRDNKMAPLTKDDLRNWFKINPYEKRAKAVTEKITILELGRIFYHLSQRRGFLSNRKSQTEGEGKKEKKTIFEGKPEEGKIGITETEEKIEKHKTLGSYLYEISYKEREKFSEKERIRNRYTLRKMYEQEFDAIWDTQSKFYPNILTDFLRYEIGYKSATKKVGQKNGILFFQRPLRSQKKLLGKCTFESKKFYDKKSTKDNKWITIGKTRCPISHPTFEMYRTYLFLNTIIYGDNSKLDDEQKKYLIEELFNKKDKFKFSQIKNKLKLIKNEVFNYKDKDNVAGNYTISKLSKLFTLRRWKNFSEKEKNDIWHIIYEAKDKTWIQNYAEKNWNFDDKQIEQLHKINFKQDYSNLSLKAIRNITPFLLK